MNTAELLTESTAEVRERLSRLLAKTELSAAEAKQLPGLLADAGISRKQAARVAELLQRIEAERPHAEGLAEAASKAVQAQQALDDQLEEERAQRISMAAKTRTLTDACKAAKQAATRARTAKFTIAEAATALRRIMQPDAPRDLAEVRPVFTDAHGERRYAALFDLPDAEEVAVSHSEFGHELDRRRRVLAAYHEATIDERREDFNRRHAEWLPKAQSTNRSVQQQHDRRAAGHEVRAKFVEPIPEPRMQPATYAGAFEAGQHRTEKDPPRPDSAEVVYPSSRSSL